MANQKKKQKGSTSNKHNFNMQIKKVTKKA